MISTPPNSHAMEEENALSGPRSGLAAEPAASARWIARKAICFNYLPVRYAHPSHWESLLPRSLCNRLLRTARGEAMISRLLLSAYGLLGKWQADFSQRSCRLALAASHLPRLALYAGAFFHAPAIAQTIDRKSIAEIKARIGADAYAFALRRSPLFQKWRPFDPPASDPSSGLEQAIESAGLHALAVAFAGAGAALRERLRLCWPAGRGLEALETEHPRSAASSLFLAQIFCQEIAPEWTPHLL